MTARGLGKKILTKMRRHGRPKRYDLLECKNFGVTSLNEVREKLTDRNLKLRGD